MKEERMQVLNMLAEGKISAEEAARLLELLTKQSKPEFSMPEFSMPKFTIPKGASEDFKAFNEKVENVTKEFVEKVEKIAKEVEPKIKKTAQVVVEKAVAATDEISKIFQESCSNNCQSDCNDDENKEN